MEHSNYSKKTLREKVLARIENHTVTATSRWYFIMRIVLIGFLTLFALLLSSLICNSIVFIILSSGRSLLLDFGTRGIWSFLIFFPWPLLLIDLLCILLLQRLLSVFKFGYRIPVLYLGGLIFVIGFGLGIIIHHDTPFNHQVVREGERRHFSGFLNDFLRGAHRPPSPGQGMYRGTIQSVGSSSIIILDSDTSTSTLRTIILSNDNEFATTTGLHSGDMIFIAGDERDGNINAFGIHTTDKDDFEEPHENESSQ